MSRREDVPWWGLDARLIWPIDTDTGSARPGTPRCALELGGKRIDSNPEVAGVLAIPDVLDAHECARAIALAAARPFTPGRMTAGPASLRRCVCAWIPPDDSSRWLYAKIASTFAAANLRFRFALEGLVEPPMAISYRAGDGFDWHLDAGPELAANRKLSLSLLLSGPERYRGGELQFSGAQGESFRPRAGTAVVFPSFLAHRVAPVESGTRIALAAFAYGPSFR